MNNFEYQERYWSELKEHLGQIEFSRMYLIQSERYDTWIKGFLAVVSSGAIAGWAIWQDPSLNFLWASLVAGAQVINSISKYFPWEKRTKAIRDLMIDFEEIKIFSERNWYEVAEGLLSIREIHHLTIEIKSRQSQAEAKSLKDITLPDNLKFSEEASQKVDKYCQYYYGSDS